MVAVAHKRHHWHWCKVCGKRTYLYRQGAKDALRVMRRGEAKGMRPYPSCAGPFWHVGHLPRNVLKGQITAREIYG